VKLYPKDGKKRTVVDTYLKREADQWLPSAKTFESDTLPFFEAQGKTAPGMNLDGKVGPNDFTSPEGEKGIDNQMYRAAGCVADFRGPSITGIWWYEDVYVRRYVANRYMIEISGVDSLDNDDDVTVKSYRGIDDLLFDQLGDDTGDVITPGGTQRIDERWGKWAEATWKGKIVNGVLITEAGDGAIPTMGRRDISTILPIKAMRFKLKLTQDHAGGMLGGYVGVQDFEVYINKDPQARLAEGNMPAISLFHAVRRLADGYPDPKTGEMTAISSAMTVQFTRVNIVHPEKPKSGQVASAGDRKSQGSVRTAGQ
jgi:hypothetical protein